MENIDFYKNKIATFYKTNKRMPSYSEMAKIFGYKSKNAVYKLVQKLISHGLLTKDSLGHLIPNALTNNLKVLGLVEAGFATEAEESLLDTISLDDFLIQKQDTTYMLQVKGDSMYDAGIREGDMVIVEKTLNPKIGQIVVAEVDGGWTMKYLRQDKKGQMYLEPANKAFPNIYPEESLNIRAVVKAVIRKY